MAAVHRPDFDAWRKQESSLAASRQGSTQDRDCFMWPYINQEDLLKPKTLLLLLNARGRHHPSHFAGADFDAMHLGCVTQRIVAVFLNCYVMILHGARDAREYGKLVAWEEHPDAFEWMHTRRQFMPGEGLLVLEAQERTLSFLVKCCELILHDIPSDTLTTDVFPVQPEPEFKNEQEADGFDSLAAMAAEAPYRLPARLDLDRIQSLLGTKVAAARDHIWSLREDPGYFAEQLAEIKEHRQEMIKDINGNAHPTLSRLKQDTDADADIETSASPIRVDTRSFKVFRTLFFDPNVTSHPGQVSWKDFLHAMTATGIFAAEKLYGSVWQFQRTDGDQSRIQFHEPHPYSKIPFVVARRIGRRLNRNYGWTGDMFVLKGTE
ncbi:hypothetical protein GQ607_003706 [Colletotrichum asianum]|uniref:Uncharacterized protein n=1 Tax=Colletotrichum asianum TaxID=702518 RepID=A0A8H3WJ68_9PEZI|nr:hypothetical protein GQ607_003706 [Colletotrichum asianum]